MGWTAARFDKIKTVLRVTSGNFLEMFDFFLFGIYARDCARVLPERRSLCLADADVPDFRGRICDAADRRAVARAYIDRMGRRQGLMVTLASWLAARC